MAKSTGLEIVNKVLKNLGESQVTDLTSLSGLTLLVFDTINELLYDIAFEYKYTPLEADGTIALSQGVTTVAMPSDMMAFDKDSFRYDETSEIKYYTPQRMDREYICQTDSGIPNKIFRWANYWRPYPIPSTSGKTIKYRYWSIPTIFSSSVSNGTCWIPEGYDLTLLADYVTWKILSYKSSEQTNLYYGKVWGDGRLNEGSLAKFKALYGSPEIIDENILMEPM